MFVKCFQVSHLYVQSIQIMQLFTSRKVFGSTKIKTLLLQLDVTAFLLIVRLFDYESFRTNLDDSPFVFQNFNLGYEIGYCIVLFNNGFVFIADGFVFFFDSFIFFPDGIISFFNSMVFFRDFCGGSI